MNRTTPPSPRALRTRFLLAIAAATALAAGSVAACSVDEPAPQKDAPVATAATAQPVKAAPAGKEGGETWNAAQIDWQPYQAGLERAKAQNKPICLVLYTTWCPHCKNFSRVFDDPRVVEKAKDFVMIHIDADQESDVAKQYAKDGSYIPRTFFLAADGTPDYDIHPQRPRFQYFYDERDPASLLGGMNEALAKLRK